MVTYDGAPLFLPPTSLSSTATNFTMDIEKYYLMVNELCNNVSLCEMIEFSSRRLSKNVQSLSILDIVG
jgi:hypothetical protein